MPEYWQIFNLGMNRGKQTVVDPPTHAHLNAFQKKKTSLAKPEFGTAEHQLVAKPQLQLYYHFFATP
jgi:hypothetical protein